jgi:outer membrane protein assembly factor BamB
MYQAKFVFDWGDGEFDTTDLCMSGETLCASHTWLAEGTFRVKALAISDVGKLSPGWSDELAVTVGPNNRPNPPGRLRGVDGGIKRQPLSLEAGAVDPDGDNIYIIFYYDTTSPEKNSGWLGPVPSGTMVVFDSARYEHSGTYYVVAYARDIHGAVSDPSPIKVITIAAMDIGVWMLSEDAFYSSPAINVTPNDTTAYVGCDDARVYAVNARTFFNRGSFTSLNEDAFLSSPAISADGQRVYIADDGGWLYCLDANGLGLLSHYPPNDTWAPGMQPFFSSPAVKDNAVYIGRDDGFLYRFDDNVGALSCRESVNTSADISSSPAISADGTRIVVGNDSGYVYCFDDTLGIVWKVLLGASVVSSPAITPGGVVHVGCEDGRLYALRLADGGTAYPPLQADDGILSSPVVDAGDRVYFATERGTIYAAQHGVLLWSKTLPYGENMSATGCLAPDTTLILNTDDGTAYGIDVNPAATEPGRILWRIEWPEPEFRRGRGKSATLASSVTVGPGNGMFYAGSTNGGFGAVRVDKPSFLTGSLPASPWPKFRHDIRNSGWSH